MGDTLRRRFGPLPVWAWALIMVGVLALYLSYRKKQAATAAAAAQAQGLSTNLGTVPVSNLTTMAQPMPVQLGDTFVNVAASKPPTVINKIRNIIPSYSLQTAPPPTPSPATNIGTPGTYQPWTMPGYGAGLGQLLANNPGLMSANTPGGTNVPGITGYTVSYNGVPL